MDDEQYKTGNCRNCRKEISVPIGECVVECKNHKCRTINLFLCHVITGQLQKKIKIFCQDCQQKYTIIRCPKCHGYEGIKNFLTGYPYRCPCGYEATFVVCCYCLQILSLPVGRNYEKTPIKCRNCHKDFSYSICSSCQTDSYKFGNQSEGIYPCPNEKCISRGGFDVPNQQVEIKESELLKVELDNRYHAEVRMSQNRDYPDQNLCKVCLNNEVNMINTTCYHLALCEPCAKDIVKANSQCPLCRAVGEFKLIYK